MDHSDSAQATPVNTETAGHPPQDAASEETGTASLDKVRDILFGVQVREIDGRFARLEERLARDTADLREDLRNRLTALEQYIKSEIDALTGRLRGENDQRTEALSRLGQDMRDVAGAFERKTSHLHEELERGQRELRQQALEQHQRLSDDLVRRSEEILATLAREAQDLRTAKTDRAALASLLSEMALRLTNEFKLPAGGD